MSRLLQWLGALGVLALAGVGIGALAVVKDRIDVTITPEQGIASPDPSALVRDDLAQLRTDIAALTAALDANLQRLAQDVEKVGSRLDVLEQRAAAPVTTTGDRGLAAESAEPAVVAPAPDAAAPAEAAPARSFLSFALPSAQATFDRPQRYRVIANLSRVGFDAKSTLHDFTGVTSSIEGEIEANLADPTHPWRGTISCDARTLDTGVDGRDEEMLAHLDTARHPRIEFAVTGFRANPDAVDVARQKVAGTVLGTMTIRGVSRAIEMPVTISVDDSKRVVVDGQTTLALTDYDVPVPSKLGLISMQDRVSIWIALRARAAGAVAETARAR